MLYNGSVRCFSPSQVYTTSLLHIGFDDLVVGLHVLKGLFQRKPFYDFMLLIANISGFFIFSVSEFLTLFYRF